MKKVFFALATVVALSIVLVACKDDEQPTEVKISAAKVTLLEGQTAELTLSPQVSAVRWVSGNPTVATVDANGKVTALSLGKAAISAVTAANTVYCSVEVVMPVESITLKESETLMIGTKLTLKPTIEPANATNTSLVWASSNSNIAKVDSLGEVSGLDSGKVLITATALDGNKVAQCSVTVTYPFVTGVSLDRNPIRTLYVGHEYALKATVSPAEALNKNIASWVSDNEAVATVSKEGVVTGVGAGVATIMVTTQEGAKTGISVVNVFDSYPSPTIGGVKWAGTNLASYKTFAAKNDAYSSFFQWGDTVAYPATGSVTGWKSSVTTATWNNPCPDGWRLPTQAELKALGIQQREATATDGQVGAGFFYSSKQASRCRMFQMYGNAGTEEDALSTSDAVCVYFPASGYRGADGALTAQGIEGHYWSAEQWTDNNVNAFSWTIKLKQLDINPKAKGLNIRCVQDL